MWNEIAELRTLAYVLQWGAIALVFVGGFLQLGSLVVDHRVTTLSDAAQAEKLNPVAQTIRTGTAVIELIQESKDAANNHFMDSGAALGLAQENQAIMVLRSLDSFAVQNGKSEIIWRSTLALDLADASVGKPIRSLRDADHMELTFGQLKSGAVIKSGSVTIIINSAVQLQANIPAQTVDGQQLFFIRELSDVKAGLK
jgi:2-keto-4-pentenoate hydratase